MINETDINRYAFDNCIAEGGIDDFESFSDDDCRMLARRLMQRDRNPNFNLRDLTAAIIRQRDLNR